MTPLLRPLRLFSLLFFGLPLAALEPKQAVWSSDAFGADGPWNAVKVSLGNQSSISLFPGHMWNTFVTTSDYCAVNNSVPHCASGTYLKDSAVAISRQAGPALSIDYKGPTQEMLMGIKASGTCNMFLETIDMQFEGGNVRNHSISIIENKSQLFEYPDGTKYPIFAGCLSVGSPERQQVFEGLGARPTINATMIPWEISDGGNTSSSSFGMHYGSAAPSAKVPGSLLFGGYDRNRVVGKVFTIDGDLSIPVGLQDISITVIQGSSPFFPSTSTTSSASTTTAPTSTAAPTAPTSIPGLLAQGNSTFTDAGLPVLLDPCSPYLTLPKSTCDAIASHLPVIYNASLGLYLWNTTSPRYNPIITSASALSFTFINLKNTPPLLTIHVPFRHLNLTLSPPFTASPRPYFPCFTGGIGAYVLGRAFFQDAFLGANWERKKVWLAQAPGPNVNATADKVTIQHADEGVQSLGGGSEWEKSWEGVWKGLTEEEAKAGIMGGDGSGLGTGSGGGGGGGGGDGQSSSSGNTGNGGTGLSTAVMAGIGVGAAVGGMALVAAAGAWLWRKKKAKLAASQAGALRLPDEVSQPVEIRGRSIYKEPYMLEDIKPPGWAYYRPAEMPGEQQRVYEMAGDYMYSGPPNGWDRRPERSSSGRL